MEIKLGTQTLLCRQRIMPREAVDDFLNPATAFWRINNDTFGCGAQ